MNVAIGLAAIVIATSVALRYFAPPAEAPPSASIYLSEAAWWREAVAAGKQTGSEDAAAQVVEFIDLECPACRTFAPALDRVISKHDGRIGVVLVHLPLDFHRFARPAARAAECAADQGVFREMVKTVLSHNDSLSDGRWTEFADEAGVRDRRKFEDCMRDTVPVAAVERGVEIADKYRIQATPTLMVNQWIFSNTPTRLELEEVIAAVQAGRRPSLPIR